MNIANTSKKIRRWNGAFSRSWSPSRASKPPSPFCAGLKERYEVHHGIRIQDAALVAAATLSHRYITDRFLPDKAVDLMDEAASRLRMELDSMPTEIDQLERQIMQLEIEQTRFEKGKGRRPRASGLKKLEKELANLKEQSTRLKAQWQNEKAAINAVSIINSQIRTGQTGTGKGAAHRRSELRPRKFNTARFPSCRRNWPRPKKHCTSNQQGKRLLQPGSDRGRHRPGRRLLDRHSGDAHAGRRAAEAGAHGGTACTSA